MLRSFIAPAVLCTIVLGVSYSNSGSAIAVEQAQTTATAQASPSPKPDKPVKADKPVKFDPKNFNAEQVAELTIYSYGSRQVLAQIRRNGVERGRITRFAADGKSEEISYERKFVRGENIEKDKVRLDQKTPSLEYSLISGDGRLWGIINGSSFIPRADAASTFRSQLRQSIDSLLRYKESGSTVTLVKREKQKGVDLYILDLVDKEKQSTRYFISAKTFQVLWLEYEEAPAGTSAPLKFTRKFLDYRIVQGTRVPYRTVLLEEGRQTQETRILTITYGVKIDDSVFKNPEA